MDNNAPPLKRQLSSEGKRLFNQAAHSDQSSAPPTTTLQRQLSDEARQLLKNFGAEEMPPPIPQALSAAVPASSPSQQERKTEGLWLERGVLPLAEPASNEQLMRVKFKRYDPDSKRWVTRKVPLNDEELDCWREQSTWLMCPISGKKWTDGGCILGVGLYHAPRFLCDEERARQSADGKRIAAFAKRRAEAAGTAAAAAAGAGSTAMAGDGGSGDGGSGDGVPPPLPFALFADDGGGSDGDGVPPPLPFEPAPSPAPAGASSAAAAAAGAGSTFNVYPSVRPPPASHLRRLRKLPLTARMGRVEVIVGPVFDISAYNRGARTLKERGVLDMDQQYNAMNFVFYVPRAGGGAPQRKACTNRLSFYIEESHGSRVFPKNIESQLSLLVYRDRRRIRDSQGNTDPRILAACIKQVIPKVLKAVVCETITSHWEVDGDKFDLALRHYLLIHQIAVKLVIRYKRAYSRLYRSIMRFVQNPFSPQARRTWPDLEQLLIAASLVGVPWNLLREAFMRRLLATMLSAARVSDMKEGASDAVRLRHLYHQNRGLIFRVLYEFSFFVAGRGLLELDAVYGRCAGSLPRAERERMKQMALAVKEVTSFESFWVTMGMDRATEEPEEVRRHIVASLSHVMRSRQQWEGQQLPPLQSIVVPPLDRNAGDVGRLGILGIQDQQREERERHQAEERAKHRGMPLLNKRGELARLKCNYPLCARTFRVRAHLFQHLRRMIPDWEDNYHKSHWDLRLSMAALQTHVEAVGAFQCPSPVCDEAFPSLLLLQTHLADMGTPGFFLTTETFRGYTDRFTASSPAVMPGSADAAGGESKGGGGAEYDDMDTCVVCLDEERETVLVPCGHLALCSDCGLMLSNCPICRTQIQARLTVYYARRQRMKVFRA